MIDGQDRGGHKPGKAEQWADDDLFKLVNTYFVLATKTYLSRDHLFITGNKGVPGNRKQNFRIRELKIWHQNKTLCGIHRNTFGKWPETE